MGMVLPPDVIFEESRIPLEKAQGGYGITNWKETVTPPEGGLFAYYRDEPYPRKGHPYPESVEANNIVKKITIGLFVSLAVPEIILPAFGFLLLPWKRKIKWLEKILFNYCRVADYTLRLYYMKRQYYNGFAQELWNLTYYFLKHLGISSDLAYRCGKIVANMFELEDAYRARVQDIFSELSIENLNNPRKEVNRLVKIYLSREGEGIQERFVSVAKILSYLLLIPRFKRIFVNTLKQANISKLRFDEIDIYWTLNRANYKYLGRDDEDRFTEYKNRHNEFALKKFRELALLAVTDPKAKLELQKQLILIGN